MISYQLKVQDRAEGPYTEDQISQMFADGHVDRYTPCRPANGGDWKAIDDFLPMLKYGTQLPSPKLPSLEGPVPSNGIASGSGNPLPSIRKSVQQVTLMDINLPFGSIVKLMFKWAAAAILVGICLVPALIVAWVILMALAAIFFGSTFSFLHRP